jgi:hypothetical protein
VRTCSLGKATDYEFLSLLTLQLKPRLSSPHLVARIDAFRDDAFEAHLASGLQNAGAVSPKRLAESDAVRRVVGQAFFQYGAAGF